MIVIINIILFLLLIDFGNSILKSSIKTKQIEVRAHTDKVNEVIPQKLAVSNNYDKFGVLQEAQIAAYAYGLSNLPHKMIQDHLEIVNVILYF